MLSIKKIISIYTFLYSIVCFCQFPTNKTYITYEDEFTSKHYLKILEDEIILLFFSDKNITPKKKLRFNYKIEKDTLLILNKKKVTEPKTGIILDDDKYASKFKNTRFYKKTKESIIHVESKKLYYDKKNVDSILKNQVIFSVNSKILMSQKDSATLNKILNKNKFKTKKIKVIKPKKAIKTYGILGLNGVIEIKGKFKKCK